MWKKIGIGFAVLIVLGLIFGGDSDSSSSSASSSSSKNYMNTWVKTYYFDVGITGAKLTKRALGGQYSGCDNASNGSQFVVLDVAIKNTDTESRTLLETGEIHILSDGKNLKYENPVDCTLFQDGYLNFMDDAGPMVEKRGKVAFEVPAQFSLEDMSYQVPRDNVKIALQVAPTESAETSSN
tara:strand:- start:1047 stop:1592 length:546 start_codon:yes stop_codon:yes gene_type:complete